MKIETNKLEGKALDWAVAMAFCPKGMGSPWIMGWLDSGSPSSSWEKGGQIIERHRITLDTTASEKWEAYAGASCGWFASDKPLVAAMRAFVAVNVGYEVDIPDELMEC